MESSEHKECVLFKSNTNAAPDPVVQPNIPVTNNPVQAATYNPKTGPEHYILLMLLAMILGFGFIKMKKSA